MSDSLDVAIRALLELGAYSVRFRRAYSTGRKIAAEVVYADSADGSAEHVYGDTADECVAELARKILARQAGTEMAGGSRCFTLDGATAHGDPHMSDASRSALGAIVAAARLRLVPPPGDDDAG